MHATRGFTFIEMVVTLAIMGLLAAVAVPMIELTVQRNREKELRSSLMQIREALDAYKKHSDQGRIPLKIGESGYPKTLEELVEGVTDVKSPQRQKVFFLRRLPKDPMSADAELPAGDTWGKRSYSSPPDDPREGEDVFDVFSRSTAVGLNGVPYNQW